MATGDAENDLLFKRTCVCAVPAGNAVPAVKDTTDVVTAAARGAGVIEAIDSWLTREGKLLAADIARHSIIIGRPVDGDRELMLRPEGDSVLIKAGFPTQVSALLKTRRSSVRNA